MAQFDGPVDIKNLQMLIVDAFYVEISPKVRPVTVGFEKFVLGRLRLRIGSRLRFRVSLFLVSNLLVDSKTVELPA